MYRVMIRVFICVMCNVLIHFFFVANNTKDVDEENGIQKDTKEDVDKENGIEKNTKEDVDEENGIEKNTKEDVDDPSQG